jgi:hypothetical protein
LCTRAGAARNKKQGRKNVERFAPACESEAKTSPPSAMSKSPSHRDASLCRAVALTFVESGEVLFEVELRFRRLLVSTIGLSFAPLFSASSYKEKKANKRTKE